MVPNRFVVFKLSENLRRVFMPNILDMELGKTAYVVINKLCKVKPRESVLITIDGLEEFRVAEEIAKAAEAADAKVIVAWHSTPPGYGKVGDPYLPDPLKVAIPNTDVWIELNNQWLLYSTPWDTAMKPAVEGTGKVRYLFLGGLNVDQIVRRVGRVNNSGARLSGLCTEDERVWGCTEWGFGHQGPAFRAKGIRAVSHADGICLKSSVWIDEQQIMDAGRLVHPELAKLAKKLGRE